MGTQYTVQQGDTLLRIAKQHKFSRSSTIYDHPSNEAFRKLRPDPNIIYPGDKINIPDKDKAVQTRPANGRHSFTVKKPEVEMFRVKIQDDAGVVLEGKRATLEVGDETIDALIGADGLIEIPLPNGDEAEGELQVFLDPDSDEPTHIYEVQLGHLDPADTVSGVQARCNALGFDAGVVDDTMGPNTSEAIKDFQSSNGLAVDGEITDVLTDKLKEIYGS